MNSPAFGLRLASVITGLVSLAHLLRLFVRFQVIVGSYTLPVWLSGVAFVVFGLLSFWLCRLARAAKPAAP
jgi:hypothetical protein